LVEWVEVRGEVRIGERIEARRVGSRGALVVVVVEVEVAHEKETLREV